jgi:hypothetical protein
MLLPGPPPNLDGLWSGFGDTPCVSTHRVDGGWFSERVLLKILETWASCLNGSD